MVWTNPPSSLRGKVIKIAFQFPKGMPKLPTVSGLMAPLRTPEAQFESLIKKTFNFEVPKGPLAMLSNFQRSLEAGETPEFPGFPELPSEFPQPPFELEGILAKFPKLPGLPELPGQGGSSSNSPSIYEKEHHSPFENTHTRAPGEVPAGGTLLKNSGPSRALKAKFPTIVLTKS